MHYTDLYTWENLLLAYRRAARGKRRHAMVAGFEHRLEEHLLLLQEELAAQRYQPGPYTSFYIHEPKRRLISAAPLRDRVVHHALCNLIEPPFERSFTADAFANRVGKGTHRALDRAQGLTRRHPYVLQCDLRQFFPSIDHAILRAILARDANFAACLPASAPAWAAWSRSTRRSWVGSTMYAMPIQWGCVKRYCGCR